MKILAKFISVDTQIHTGKCYYLGIWVTSGKTGHIYNIEAAASASADNQIAKNTGGLQMLPKPGVECSNGIYCANSANQCIVYYSLG